MSFKVKIYFFYSVLFAFVFKGFAGDIKKTEQLKKPSVTQSAIKFAENKNQWEANVLYRAQLDGGVLFLEKNCFTYNFYDKETLRNNHIGNNKSASPTKINPIRSHAFRMSFLNSETKVKVSAKQISPDYCNFYIGKDQSKWAGDVKNYREVNYQTIFDGIDLQILGLQNNMKYNFIVAPQANTNDIQLFYQGLDSIQLENGELKLKTSINEMLEQRPYAYQWIRGKQVEVPCEFVLQNNIVSFRFPKGYNKKAELIIDPILVFAVSSGSTSDNFGMTATYDSQGNLYSGGTCFDQGYPTTLGVYDDTFNGTAAPQLTDVVITKYNATGTALIYSTYLGGAISTEIVSSLIVNAQNELMLFGATGSDDFPITTGAYDNTFAGGPFVIFASNGTQYNNGTDLYLAKFNDLGTSLLASTYVGGTKNDGVNNSIGTLVYNYGDYYRGEIQTDPLGNFYIASCTYSTDFPTTGGSAQPNFGGGNMDGLVFRMNPSLTTLAWSTFIGGNADDGCYALSLDKSLNVYTTGGTASGNFPTTSGALSTTYGGGRTDGFITKIKNDGSTILKSTFVGTSFYDESFLIQLDNDANVFILGQSEGTMPVSTGVYSNANSKQFIWKVDNNLSTQLVTTIFGNGNGTVNISPSAFLIDTCGNIYASGWGGNVISGNATLNMPVTSDAFQSSTDGFNFYLIVLSQNATSLLYATYFGGATSQEHVDGGTSRFDKRGIVYQAVCSGCGGNDDFPVTAGAWPNLGADVNQSTNCNMGDFKFDFQLSPVNAVAIASPSDTICVGSSVDFSNTSINAVNYLWDFGDGSPLSADVAPSHQYLSSGDFDVQLVAIDSFGCIFADTIFLKVSVLPKPLVNFGNDTLYCQAFNRVLSAGINGSIYNWSTGETTSTISVNTPGTYWATNSNGVCMDSDTIDIKEYIPPTLGLDTTLCQGQNITLDADSSATYLWSTGETTRTINVSAAGLYWVSSVMDGCQKSDSVDVSMVPYPVVDLPSDAAICPGNSITLDAGAPAAAYTWSTGATTQIITLDSAGVYIVTASNASCKTLDSTMVIEVSAVVLDENITLCNAENYTLDAGIPGAIYLWSTGDTTKVINVLTEGIYWVEVNVNGCVITDTVKVEGSLGAGILWFPNSFTPNNNGLNDIFIGQGADITYIHMLIFNRWGELIFETEKLDEGWNGKRKGVLSELGVYVWKVEYKSKCTAEVMNEKIGSVTLVR